MDSYFYANNTQKYRTIEEIKAPDEQDTVWTFSLSTEAETIEGEKP